MSEKWNEAQLKILNTLSGNMVASASAGSGKTTVMLERIIRLVKQGNPIKKMVVLAYNVSIATELKNKLKQALTNLLEQDDIDNIFLAEQIDDVDSCNICTIDSFCSSLIKEYFQLIKIDTNFSIMTEIQQKTEFRRIAKSVLQDIKDSDATQIYDIFLMYGSQDKMVEELFELNRFIASLPNRDDYLNAQTLNMYSANFYDTQLFKSFKKLLINKFNYVLEIIDEALFGEKDLAPNKGEQLNYLRAICCNIINGNTHDLIMILSSDIKSNKLRATKADDALAMELYSKAISAVKDALKLTEFWISQDSITTQQKLCGKTVKTILQILDKISKLFIEYKRERALFDFSDLTYWAIKALENDSVSNELKNRFTSVCIDEFQDANFCQDYILSKITNDNLFIVGDTKQSIYGFRLAEPSILTDKFNACSQQNNAEAVRLNYNYRSDEFVLEFVNRIFDHIMNLSLTGTNYAKDERLIAGMNYEHNSAINNCFDIKFFVSLAQDKNTVYDFNTDIYDITKQEYGVDIKNSVLQEGEYVAQKISELITSRQIYDAKLATWRNIKYSDICIIAKSRTRQLQQILEIVNRRGIPIDTKSLELKQEDYYVNCLSDMLRVVDNDCQDYCLASALLSPWGQMSYQELVDIRAKNVNAKFFYQACQSQADSVSKLKKFYDLLKLARLKLATSSLYEVASWLVYDNNFYDALGFEPDGDNKKHIIKQYLDIIKMSNISLSEYIAGLDGEQKLEYTQYPNSGAKDMVATATIHASKGLEYPIVFLVDCNDPIHKKGDYTKPSILLPRRVEGVAIDCFDTNSLRKTNSIFSSIFKEIKRDEEELEAMRVFYVALTRARNKLFLTANYTITQKAMDDEKMPSCDSLLKVSSFADWILYVKQKDACINHNFKFIICNAQDQKEGKVNPSPVVSYGQNYGACYQDVLDFKYPYKKYLDLGIKYTVTEINQMGRYEDMWTQATTDHSKVNRALSGTNYHKVLEHIDYSADTVKAVIDELARMQQQGVMDSQEIANVDPKEIAKVMQSSIIKYALDNTHLREKKFMLMAKASQFLQGDYGDEDILIQGAIDLVILGEKTYVVDFKKTTKSDEQIIKTYAKQLEIYAKAVEEALDVKVDGKIIVEIGSGREITI